MKSLAAPRPQVWDGLCMLVLLYCSFSVPFTIAFVSAPAGSGLSVLDCVDIAIDALFAVDILLNFLTARVGPQGTLVSTPHGIAALYLRSWFLPDFSSTVPFDLGQGSGNLAGMRWSA